MRREELIEDAVGLGACLVFYVVLWWPAQAAFGLSFDDVRLSALAVSSVRWGMGLVAGASPPAPPLTFGWGHGPFSAYLIIPFLLAFGRTQTAVALSIGAAGAATITATYSAGRALLRDRWAALVAAGLLAALPSFVSASLQAGSSGLRELPFALVSLALAAAARDGRRRWAWSASAFALGVAVGCRWTMLAWAAGWLACLAPGLRRRSLPLAEAAAAFLLGVAPLGLGWLRDSGPAIYFARNVWQHAVPSALWRALPIRLGQFFTMIGGWPVPGLAAPEPRAWLAALILSAAAVGAAAAWRQRRSTALWPLTMIVVYLGGSLFSPSELRVEHMTPLLPLCALAAAAALATIPEGAWRRRAAAASGALVFFCAICCAMTVPVLELRASAEASSDALSTPFVTRAGFALCDWQHLHPREDVQVLTPAVWEYAAFCAPRWRPLGAPPFAAAKAAVLWTRRLSRRFFLIVAPDRRAPGFGDASAALRGQAARRGLALQIVLPFGGSEREPLGALVRLQRRSPAG